MSTGTDTSGATPPISERAAHIVVQAQHHRDTDVLPLVSFVYPTVTPLYTAAFRSSPISDVRTGEVRDQFLDDSW